MDSASNSTGESVSTGSETVTDSASDTSSGTTSDNTETESETGTTSDESETESETDSDSSGTTPDPEGEEFMPQFGLKLPVLLEGSAPQSTSLRVQMMKIAMAPEDSAPGVQTAFQPAGIWRDWPLDLEENQGEVVLPTPAPEELEQGVSPRMALMVYDDQNQNRRFDPSESYIAGYSGHFRYASASAGKPERWSIDSRLANLATSVENTSFERPLLLSRIDAGKPVRGLSGTMANVDEEVAYLSTFSSAELADFQSAYLDQNRAFDLSLRDEEREEWTLRPQRAPAFGTEAMLAIPGIDANQLATLWIGGYQRPVDAAFAPDGSFLTPDSTMISRICNEAGDFPAALWIQGRDWITSPQGALYAVLYNLGPGWNFVTLEDNPEAPNSPIVVAGDRFSTPTYWIQADRCPAFPALEFVP